jgi:membrane protease YdiL (CAAX protease family)
MADGATGSSSYGGEPSPVHQTGLAGWLAALLALVTTGAIVAVALVSPVFVDLLVGPMALDHGDGPTIGGADERVGQPGWIHLIAFQVTVVVLAVLMADPRGRQTAANLAWQPLQDRRAWLTPFIVTFLVSILIALVVFTFFPDVVERDLAPIRQMVRDGPLWLAFAALAIGAPLSEELLFRGYLLQRLKHTPLGFWGGALIANIAWTALHFGYSWLSLADVFIAGLLFTWALWRTGSIWVPITFHAIYNAIVFFIMLIPEQDRAAAATFLPGFPL